jgi:hypothetical protein
MNRKVLGALILILLGGIGWVTWSRVLSPEAVARARVEAVAVSFWQAVSAGDSAAIGSCLHHA